MDIAIDNEIINKPSFNGKKGKTHTNSDKP